MMGHKICFYEEILIIIPKLSLLLLLIWSPAYTDVLLNMKSNNRRNNMNVPNGRTVLTMDDTEIFFGVLKHLLSGMR